MLSTFLISNLERHLFMHDMNKWSTDVSSFASKDTVISPYVLVADNAKIGKGCYIGPHSVIERNVKISDNVTVGAGVHFCPGVRVSDAVTIGSSVSFTALATDKLNEGRDTIIEIGAVIGDGAIIHGGISVGQYAQVAPGALLTRSVPPNSIVEGNPARIVGYVNASSTTRSVVESKISGDDLYKSDVNGVCLYSFPLIKDMRGSLTVGEFERSIPFPVKRYFMVFDVPSVETRGEHAHYRCHQFLICVKGSISVVADDGRNREEFILNRPELGLYLPPMTWGIQYKYSSDAVLLVFASEHYDAKDYIRDYDDFLELTR